MAIKSLVPRRRDHRVHHLHWLLFANGTSSRATCMPGIETGGRGTVPQLLRVISAARKSAVHFDLDVLYLDICKEEEGLPHFLGILKEIELARLKYIAINEEYLMDGVVDLCFITAVLQRALKTMTDLEEMVVVRDTTIEGPCTIFQPLGQMKFYAEQRMGEAEERWPTDVEELPDIHEEYSNWKLSNVPNITPIYGQRPV